MPLTLTIVEEHTFDERQPELINQQNRPHEKLIIMPHLSMFTIVT